MTETPLFTVVIPVYNNEEFVELLVDAFERIGDQAASEYGVATEFVFVVDGSPDGSLQALASRLPTARFNAVLVTHSRNFGSFAAVRSGLAAGRGDYFAVIAADLQEPPELLLSFLAQLRSGNADVAVGRREERDDPLASELSSRLFWSLYRRFVIRDVPPGGVDVFGCTKAVRDVLLSLPEVGSALIAQLFWVGFRRVEVPYSRRRRQYGKSGWTFRKKCRYLLDSVFSFTDLPIRLLLLFGTLGVAVSVTLGFAVVILRLAGVINLPGYSALMIATMFFGALNTLGLGLVGAYAARAYENSKMRPISIVANIMSFNNLAAGEGAKASLPTRPALTGAP
jgi:glycosyltransferase involved in cell wall biosynthesis